MACEQWWTTNHHELLFSWFIPISSPHLSCMGVCISLKNMTEESLNDGMKWEWEKENERECKVEASGSERDCYARDVDKHREKDRSQRTRKSGEGLWRKNKKSPWQDPGTLLDEWGGRVWGTWAFVRERLRKREKNYHSYQLQRVHIVCLVMEMIDSSSILKSL